MSNYFKEKPRHNLSDWKPQSSLGDYKNDLNLVYKNDVTFVGEYKSDLILVFFLNLI